MCDKIYGKKVYIPSKGVVEMMEYSINEPEDYEVQVKAKYSIISPGTERAYILNLENTDIEYPITGIGYCNSGVITKIGKKVTRIKVGDRVAAKENHDSIFNAKEDEVYVIPEGVDIFDATFSYIATIAMQGVRKAKIELGESVVVFGQGIIGHFAVQMAKASGAFPVIALDRAEDRLISAKKCGADFVVNTSDKDWKEKVLALTNEKGPNIVIESTGFPQPIADSFDLVADKGRVVLLGSTRGNIEVNFYKYVHKKGIMIIGAHVLCMPENDSSAGSWTCRDNINTYLNMLKFARIDIREMISDIVPVSKVVDTYNEILQWKTKQIVEVIDWEKE